MNDSVFSQIEDGFEQLSIPEQLRLIERLVRRVHEATLENRNDLDQQLALMSTDPEIQNEMQTIEREFSNADI